MEPVWGFLYLFSFSNAHSKFPPLPSRRMVRAMARAAHLTWGLPGVWAAGPAASLAVTQLLGLGRKGHSWKGCKLTGSA